MAFIKFSEPQTDNFHNIIIGIPCMHDYWGILYVIIIIITSQIIFNRYPKPSLVWFSYALTLPLQVRYTTTSDPHSHNIAMISAAMQPVWIVISLSLSLSTTPVIISNPSQDWSFPHQITVWNQSLLYKMLTHSLCLLGLSLHQKPWSSVVIVQGLNLVMLVL